MGTCHSNGKSTRAPNFSSSVQVTVYTTAEDSWDCSEQTVADSRRKRRKFKSKTNRPGSLRSSRRYYSDALVRKNLDLERHDSKASLIPRIFSFSTPSRSRRKGKDKLRAKENNHPRKARQHREITLSKKLKGLSKEQLAELILQVSNSNPQIEKEFDEICPNADLVSHKRKLLHLLDGIYKAFPKHHIGSMRDSTCFYRVLPFITIFKNECAAQCEQFYKDGLWSVVIEHVLIVWPIINRLPEWNDDDHNILKRSLMNHFVMRLRNSIRANKFTDEEAWLLKKRIEEALKIDRSIEVVNDDINRIIYLQRVMK